MKAPSKLSVESVAKEIEENKDAIVKLFEKKLNERIYLNFEKNQDVLSSTIHDQIETIVKTLRRYSLLPDKSKWGPEAQIEIHGLGLPLEVLISEHITLKDVIFEILQKKDALDVEASNIIWRYIVYSIQEVASKFERDKKVEINEISHELEDSDNVNKSISKQIVSTKQNEERFKTLVEGIEDYAVFTIDPSGIILSWNPGAAKMKGYSADEVLGKHFSMLYTKEGRENDEPMDHLHEALIDGRYRGEGMRQKKNGEHFLADVYIRPIYEGGKHIGFAKVVADLTERINQIRTADQNRCDIENLEEEKQERENFVTRLAHDLRGPLSVARAATELVRRDSVSPQSIKFSNKAILSIDRVNKMIGDLLDANRIIAGEKHHLKLQSWDIVRLAKTVCHDFEVLGAQIHFHSSHTLIKGIWDGESTRRILENLISNAVKYGDSSRPISVEVSDLDDTVLLSVHNFGDVISTEDQQSLFSQFRRTKSGKHKKGWGIGLSLVKGFAEAQGGRVEVESYPIEGTTFKVTLPKFVVQADSHNKFHNSSSKNHSQHIQ